MSITPLNTLRGLREQWRTAQRRLVLTNGVFDLLHVGHVEYLEQARALGDILVVAINSDSSTRALKGPQRPLIPEQDRARMLAALRCVAYVTLFAEPTAEAVVAALRPDYYVKGGDYAREPGAPDAAVDEARLPEAQIARAYGGQVVLLPYRAGYSTSALVARIVRSAGEG
jgi:rfaE bifunctional protein nucleotidyltransferase chain/domain